jgi:uncharacterized protein YjbI with pentapeptide repeats
MDERYSGDHRNYTTFDWGQMNDWLSKLERWSNRNRAWTLLLSLALTIAIFALINFLSGSDLLRQIFFPKPCRTAGPPNCDPLEWKDLFQATILVVSLPIAFFLWHWRDRNVRDQIENQRSDITLKEFQDVQLRAAGAIDDQLSEGARQELQLSSLHQLGAFLRGEYGSRYKRPAFELLLAGHAAAVERVGITEELDKLAQDRSKSKDLVFDFAKLREQAFLSLKIVDRARMAIISNEWEHIFHSGFPLSDRNFSLLDLSNRQFNHNIDFSRSSFICTNFIGCEFERKIDLKQGSQSFSNMMLHLEFTDSRAAEFDGRYLPRLHPGGVVFFGARMEGAQLNRSKLAGSVFSLAHLSGANFRDTDLREAHFWGAGMGGTSFIQSSLHGAEFRGHDLEHAFLGGTVFDDTTRLLILEPNGGAVFGWESFDAVGRQRARDSFRKLGARHVDDPKG